MELGERLTNLSLTNDWQAVIELFSEFPLDEKSKFLWAWPTHTNLIELRALLADNGIDTVLSIGCGSGLLEWVIKNAIDVNVFGLELDHSWWKSPYAPKVFIALDFVTEPSISAEVLCECARRESERFALLFCYFNNRQAFVSYVRAYSGNCIIIIGPIADVNIVTDPMPLDPMFETPSDWTRIVCMQMQGQDNCMAIYKRTREINGMK